MLIGLEGSRLKGVKLGVFQIMRISLQFKESLSKKLNVEIDSLCLIFAGRILKDAETLKSYGTVPWG